MLAPRSRPLAACYFGGTRTADPARLTPTGKMLWESVLGGMIVNSTISYAVNGKQYVMVFTGEGQSVTAGPLGLTKGSMPSAVRGHNSIFVFALP